MKTIWKSSIGCLAVGSAIACSHAQPTPPAAPAVAQAAPPPRSEPRPAPVEAAVAAVPSRGEDAIYFKLDAALIQAPAQPVLQQVARHLQLYPGSRVRIEGNCDERGTTEYNLALGEQRARAARQYLMRLGIPESRIEVVSFGSERPRSSGHDESAWAENRRDDFRMR
jgi:peptidoglycan-associated lipoprotein